MRETKSEIRARIDELDKLRLLVNGNNELHKNILDRQSELMKELQGAEEDLFESVLQSHKTICAIKKMDEDEAYGQDPATYYTLAVCGEAGEMANKIVKAFRRGNAEEVCKQAVISELPDVIIYSAVLAHCLNIDLTRLVNEKVKVVIERAESGYYGGPIIRES